MTLCTEISPKDIARSILKKKRSALSLERRKKAYSDLNVTLLPLLKSYKTILSFYNLPEEIDVSFVNRILAEEGKLLLPKVQEGALMQIYQVKNLSSELLRSKWGLLEPDPSKCLLIDIKNTDCILVPGLGFDIHHHRIGYGKGHYDQLLAECAERSLFPKTIGLGFKEQYCENGLPHEPHDKQVDELKLF